MLLSNITNADDQVTIVIAVVTSRRTRRRFILVAVRPLLTAFGPIYSNSYSTVVAAGVSCGESQ